MTVQTLLASGGSPSYVSANSYLPVGGYVNSYSSAEGAPQIVLGNAVTINGFGLTTKFLIAGGAGSAVTRVAGSSGNSTVSWSGPSTSTNYTYQDTTHTDSVSAGSGVDYLVSPGSSYPQPYLLWTALTGGVTAWVAGASQGVALSGSTTQYLAPSGGINSQTVEAYAAFPINGGGTWEGLSGRVSANTTTTSTAVASRVSGSTGNQALSYGSGVTGVASDTTHSDSVVAGQTVDLQVTFGGTGSLTLLYLKSEVALTASMYDLVTTASGNLSTVGNYTMGTGNQASEAVVQTSMPLAAVYTNLRAYPTNTTSNAMAFRVSGANGNQALSMASSAVYTDTTHNDSVSAGTLSDVQSTGGSSSLYWIGVTSAAPSTAYSLTASESGSGADSSSASLLRVGSVAESGSASDGASEAYQSNPTTTESGSAADSAAASAAFRVSSAEAGSASDAPGAFGQVWYESVSEAGAAADAPAAVDGDPEAVSESGAAADAASAAVLHTVPGVGTSAGSAVVRGVAAVAEHVRRTLMLEVAKDSFTVLAGSQAFTSLLDGAASLFSPGYVNGAFAATVRFQLSQAQCSYFWAFYRLATQGGASSFVLNVVVDGDSPTPHLAWFVPKSVSIVSSDVFLTLVEVKVMVLPQEYTG